MIGVYISHGEIGDVRHLFDEMPERNAVSWNSMFMAYSSARRLHATLKLFSVMPNDRKDGVGWTTIIAVLVLASCTVDACKLFEEVPNSDSAFGRRLFPVFRTMVYHYVISRNEAQFSLFHKRFSCCRRFFFFLLSLMVSSIYYHAVKIGFLDNTLVQNVLSQSL